MIAFIFPGQGIQKKRMGKDLFSKYPEYVLEADQILGYSIEELCLKNPDDRLNLTEYTQVAIFVVNALAYLDYVRTAKIKPDFIAGHSLGEYNALFAAGALDFKTGVELVRRRGKLLSGISGGSMAAVIGLSASKVREICEQHPELNLTVSTYNTETQVIVAGARDDVRKSRDLFVNTHGGTFTLLNVNGAFHSPYMTASKLLFQQDVAGFHLSQPKIPVISNVTAREYTGTDLMEYLMKQIDSPVRWLDSVTYLLDQGVRHFVEIGYSTILTKMIDSIKESYQPIRKTSVLNCQKNELGSAEFRARYHVKYAYLAGGMYHAISSKEMVATLANADILSFYGSGGVALEKIREDLQYIKRLVPAEKVFGVNIISDYEDSSKEESLVSLLLEQQVSVIEASGYLYVTKALIRYLADGLSYRNGKIEKKNHIIAKVSRPEIAELFMSPAPEKIITGLLNDGEITREQADCLRKIPVSADLCVEADSGGHTDQGVTAVLLPVIIRMKSRKTKTYQYQDQIHVGAAGGIGTPEAAAASFLLGADFIMTGSINQCSVEAGTSRLVKEMLEQIAIQDTDYAPAGDMLEFGSKVQVLKKGTFFPARANKLYDIYKHAKSLEDIEDTVKTQLETIYFKKSFEQIIAEEMEYMNRNHPHQLEQLNSDKRFRMLTVFKWYFRNSSAYAIQGMTDRKVDFQVQCGKSLGAFNDWVKGTDMEKWENRSVVAIADYLMEETANYINGSLRYI